jgi:hypothetical protein
MLKPLIGVLLLAASTGAFAQQRVDCSKAKDRARCEERVAKFKAAHGSAEKACAGKQGDARRDCMRKQMCAQAKDPKACLDRSAKMKAAHGKAEKACAGKQGDAHRDCMREARAKAARERREQKK